VEDNAPYDPIINPLYDPMTRFTGTPANIELHTVNTIKYPSFPAMVVIFTVGKPFSWLMPR